MVNEENDVGDKTPGRKWKKISFVLFIILFMGLLIIGNNSYVSKDNTGDAVNWIIRGGGGGGSVSADSCTFGCPNQATNADSNVSFNSLTVSYLYASIDASNISNPYWLNSSDQRYNDTGFCTTLVATKDECSEISGCVVGAITSYSNNYSTALSSSNTSTNVTITLSRFGMSDLITTFPGTVGPQGVQGIQGIQGVAGTNASVSSGDAFIIVSTGVITANTTRFGQAYNDTGFCTALVATKDECSEISGCVVGAITDGNTGWDNSYDFITSTFGNSTYLPKSGGTITGPVIFNDNIKLYLGTDSDVYIMYNSTAGYGELG